MINGIIFDLDGTLLNTLYDLKEATNFTLRSLNLKEITLEQTSSYVGNGIKKLLARAMNTEEVDEKVYKIFKDYYDIHQNDNTFPYDDVITLIKKLALLNIKMAIVSNKYQQGVTNLCTPLFGKEIKVLVGSSSNLRLKPAPDMVNYALEKLNLNANECLFVGDSDVDSLTGKNANMKVCGVTWGYRSKEEVASYNNDYQIDKPLELLKIIERENKND